MPATAQPVALALYDKVLQYFTARVKSIRDGDEQLQYYNTEWTRYWIGTRLISRVFTHLDKNWVKRQRDEGNRNIFKVSVPLQLALVQWKAEVLDPINQKDRLVNTLLLAIERERNGQVVNQEVVKNVVASFIRLGINDVKPDEKCFDIYENYFETPFLVAAEKYYQGEAEAMMAATKDSNLNYLTKENSRIERYDLIPTTRTSLISVLKDAFSPPFQEIPEFSGVENLPASLSRTREGQDLLREKFEFQVEKAEKNSVHDPKTYLDTLLEVHTKYSAIITQHLYGDAGFVGSLCNACIVFVNRNAVTGPTGSKSSEVLVKYADRLLRKDKSLEEVNAEERVLMCIDKDVFLHFYAARLSKRLIYGVSASDKSEASMISKLGKACGSEYTSKLRQMLMEQFNDATFSVMVLGSNCWLLNRPVYGFTIPREIYPTYDRFQKYYRTKHSGRKLTWLWNYSRSELRTNYLDQRYVLMTSSYQMVILLLYNDHSLLSLSELVTATSIPKEIITQVVSVLVKARILVNEDSEQYSLNSNFKSKKVRVNVNQPIKAEGQTEVMRDVQEDRKYVIQATIVRIMKAQKSMNNEHLVQEVIKQISQRFTPQVPNIRKAIDILLEKEYIQQVPGDTLTYVA
ncbi:Cullin-domain-containing protein [Armillaria gallica]|uniref:Cullin-domain-containing protein n=1 Tax=Armillaria gallica TaxID=47427 RepID=A0A2H3D2V2_ARMGA|nr:Cullin-domain-containing protein [Armillaria gallica]